MCPRLGPNLRRPIITSLFGSLCSLVAVALAVERERAGTRRSCRRFWIDRPERALWDLLIEQQGARERVRKAR